MKSFALLPFAVLGVVLWTPDVAGDFDGVRRLIAEQVTSGSVPSAAVSVVRDGHILWEEAFGLADVDRRLPATPRTPYYLASVTKSLTGVALMQLASRKLVDLDRPVNAYLGRTKVRSALWDVDAATVRRLANHQSGLTTYDRECEAVDRNCGIDDTIRNYAVLVHPPGRDFDYSNLGYGILGEIVGRASGRSFGEVLQSDIFQPLKMTGCGLLGDRSARDVAVRYDSGTHAKTPERRSTTPGASAAVCSVHDLAAFSAFVLTTRSDALMSAAVPAGQGQRYSMGWWIQDDFFGYTSLYASGGTTDASATIRLIPSAHLAVAAVANTGTNLTMKATEEALADLLPRIAERSAQPTSASGSPQPRPRSGALAGTWGGIISTPQGVRSLTIVVSPSGEVRAAVAAAMPQPLLRGAAGPSRIYGVMAGDLQLDVLPADSYDLAIGVESNGERLVGFVTSQARPQHRSPALSYWVDLRMR